MVVGHSLPSSPDERQALACIHSPPVRVPAESRRPEGARASDGRLPLAPSPPPRVGTSSTSPTASAALAHPSATSSPNPDRRPPFLPGAGTSSSALGRRQSYNSASTKRLAQNHHQHASGPEQAHRRPATSYQRTPLPLASPPRPSSSSLPPPVLHSPSPPLKPVASTSRPSPPPVASTSHDLLDPPATDPLTLPPARRSRRRVSAVFVEPRHHHPPKLPSLSSESDSTGEPKKRKRRRRAGEPPRDIHLRHYLCPICEKPFARPSAMQIHVRSHNDERPFVCSVSSCLREFSVLSNLRRHVRLCHPPTDELTPDGSTAPRSVSSTANDSGQDVDEGSAEDAGVEGLSPHAGSTSPRPSPPPSALPPPPPRPPPPRDPRHSLAFLLSNDEEPAEHVFGGGWDGEMGM